MNKLMVMPAAAALLLGIQASAPAVGKTFMASKPIGPTVCSSDDCKIGDSNDLVISMKEDGAVSAVIGGGKIMLDASEALRSENRRPGGGISLPSSIREKSI